MIFLRATIGLWIGCLALLACAAAAHAETSYEITSPNIRLVGEFDPDVGVDIVGELERFRTAVLSEYGADPAVRDRRLDIYVISEPALFETLKMPPDFVAVFSPTFAGPRAIVNGSTLAADPAGLREVLHHEFVHYINLYRAPMPRPAWLEEGLAEYFSAYEEGEDGTYRLGLDIKINQFIIRETHTDHLAEAYGMLDTFSGLPQFGPGNAYPWGQTGLFYAQSWAMVRQALSRPDGLQRLTQIALETSHPDFGASRLAETYEEYQQNLAEPAPHEEVLLGLVAPDLSDYAAYIAVLKDGVGDSAIRSGTIHPSAILAEIDVRTLSEAEAAARQYHLLVMTAASPSISPTLTALRERVEADPSLEAALLVSQSALDLKLGNYGTAPDAVARALEMDPDAFEGEAIALFTEIATFSNFDYQNGEAMRARLRPWLARFPGDPELLVLMAMTGTRPDQASAESDAALATLIEDGILLRHPLLGLQLVEHASRREDYETALDRLRRGKIYLEFGGNFEVSLIQSELMSALERQEAESPPQ